VSKTRGDFDVIVHAGWVAYHTFLARY